MDIICLPPVFLEFNIQLMLVKCSIFCLQHDCQEFLALLLDSLHEQLNFTFKSTNQNTEVKPSTSKQPIRYEHNINNKVSSEHLNRGLDCVEDRSKNAVSSHSSLTFDNMKNSKSSLSGDIRTNLSSKSSVQVADCVKENVVNVDRCRSAQTLIPFTINQISEDSNHSSVSEHSSDSDQCSVMKNLKLRSSPTGTQSSPNLGMKITNDCATKDCGVSSSYEVGSDTEMAEDGFVTDGFKRVHSLQDFRQKCEAEPVITKASSDLDLVGILGDNVEVDCEKRVNFEALGKDVCVDDLDFGRVGMKNCTDIGDSVTSTCIEPVVLNNAVTTTCSPLIQDLYAKETKTLNTNVLAREFSSETITMDSDKFAKHDNTSEMAEMIDAEDLLLPSVHDETIKPVGFGSKPIKDVNIRADKKSKSPKSAAAGSGGMMNIEKEDCFDLRSVKRMKFEGTEKNLQMQEICKIQKEALLCEALNVNKPSNSNVNKASNSDVNKPSNSDKFGFRKDASPSMESDVESDMVEDVDQEVEMEVSDEEDSLAPSNIQTDREMYTASELIAAEQAWAQYHRTNDSVIVDTFQGQFKSTVSKLKTCYIQVYCCDSVKHYLHSFFPT